MKPETPPLHHLPSVQGMHQATDVPADAWEQFFGVCWDWWDELQRRREAKEQATSGEAADNAGQPITQKEGA